MIKAATEFTAKDGKTYVIKSPTEHEVEALREFMIEVAETSPYILSTPESFRQKKVESQIKWIQESAASDKSIIMALYEGDKMRGLCDAWSYPDIKRQHRASLGISLHPDTRGKGIGTHLMKVLIEAMKTFAGIKIIELDVMTNNKAALHMYEKMGFKHGGRFPNAYLLPTGEISDNLKMYLDVEAKED